MRYKSKLQAKVLFFKTRQQRKLLEIKYKDRITEVHNNFIIVM